MKNQSQNRSRNLMWKRCEEAKTGATGFTPPPGTLQFQRSHGGNLPKEKVTKIEKQSRGTDFRSKTRLQRLWARSGSLCAMRRAHCRPLILRLVAPLSFRKIELRGKRPPLFILRKLFASSLQICLQNDLN